LKESRTGARATAKAQGVRELIAPVAIASQEMAKALGVTEKQLRVLGGTVGATYLSWKLWTKLTGEPIPEYIEKLGEKSKKAAERMLSGGVKGEFWKGAYTLKESIVGRETELGKEIKSAEEQIRKEKVFSKEDLKSAMDELAKKEKVTLGKEKSLKDMIASAGLGAMRKADEVTEKFGPNEKILNESEHQTGVLHGIYEKVSQTAQNTTEFSKNLHDEMKGDRDTRKDSTAAVIDEVDKLRQGYLQSRSVGVSPIAKIGAALGVAMATGYVEEKARDKSIANELEIRAGKQSELIANIIDENQETVAKAMTEFRSQVETAIPTTNKAETETIQKAVKAEDERLKVLDNLNKESDKLKKALDDLNKSMVEASEEAARLDIGESIKNS